MTVVDKMHYNQINFMLSTEYGFACSIMWVPSVNIAHKILHQF